MADIICVVCASKRDETYATYRGDNAFCSQACASSYYQAQSIDTSMSTFTTALEGFSNTLNGFTGKSAYQEWLDLGNNGSVVDFIFSLKGSDGGDVEFQKGTTYLQWRYVGDITWNDLIPLTELKGDIGYTGIQGPQGNDGSMGPQGIQGPEGAASIIPGPQGIKGDIGNTGPQGVAGNDSVVPGPQGIKGDTGIQGIQGIQGVQGVPGQNGSDASVTKINVEAVLTGVITSHTHTAGGGNIGEFVINVQALTSSPVDSQTVYFGMLPKAPITTANISKIYIRKSVTLKGAEIYCYSGTAGTAESWSLYVRKNNTTDTLIATLAVSASERVFSNAALSVSLVAGDYLEIKGVQPLWATNPATTIYGGYLYFE
jgi:hypothetical protein